MTLKKTEFQGLLSSAAEQTEILRKENENIKKENEDLKTSIAEKEERAKQVIKTARTKIAQMTETNKALELELAQFRGQTDHTRGNAITFSQTDT